MSLQLPPSESGPKFRVAICGAGISGLVLAITIGKHDPSIPIDLYEAHDSISTAGVGINVGKKTLEVLTDLGLIDDFKTIFTHNPEESPRARRSDIREGGYPWFQRPPNNRPFSMHRQKMVAILERHLPASCTLHSGKRLVSYMHPGREGAHSTSPIRLEFADGTIATTDVLIGADGIHSVVRRIMFEAASKDDADDVTDLRQYIDATFTGMFVYRAIFPAEMLRKDNPEHLSLDVFTGYTGKGKYILTYPIVNGSIINVVAYVCDPSLTGTRYEGNWTSSVTREELVECFDDFEPDVRAVVNLCEKPSKWALHVVKPLPFCVRNRVALIGDACHATTPHHGAGAGQAIDDAFVLGRLLAHPLTLLSRVQDTLRIYEEIRLPIGRTVSSFSLSTGWMYTFMEPGFYDGTRDRNDLDDEGIGSYEREGMENMKQVILQRWKALGEMRNALQAWQDAELKLEALALGNSQWNGSNTRT